MYFQHNFEFLPIQQKGQILISNLIFELAKTLVNNICFPKPKLHFHLQNLHSNFYLSTKYKLYFIMFIKIASRAKQLKVLFPIFLFRFSLAT